MLSLHYNESSSYLFVNWVKIYQFKAKDSELNAYPVCLGNISKDVSFSLSIYSSDSLHLPLSTVFFLPFSCYSCQYLFIILIYSIFLFLLCPFFPFPVYYSYLLHLLFSAVVFLSYSYLLFWFKSSFFSSCLSSYSFLLFYPIFYFFFLCFLLMFQLLLLPFWTFFSPNILTFQSICFSQFNCCMTRVLFITRLLLWSPHFRICCCILNFLT